ncbi:MAG: hypothetical protein RL653_330 [Pseudomonadota bacterium]|jgi:transglutaminase-like putative cysteine protease
MLEMTRVGLHLGQEGERVEALGAVRTWVDGELLCRKGVVQRELHVVLSGRAEYAGGWFGPGAHTGELGFLLGVPRTADVVASGPVTTWTVQAGAQGKDAAAATSLVAALVRELPSRLRKVRPPAAPAGNFCDHGHPSIRSMAAVLARDTAEATAEAIWSFVRDLPYRFGPWWMRASDTLRAGSGMCTTKSNLEVALWRAAGLEAGFVELHGDASLVRPLLPPAWHHLVTGPVRHYLGAVRLGARWHVAEAAFTDAALRQLQTSWPRLAEVMPCRFGEGRPFHPVAHVFDQDPFDVNVLPALDEAMARRSSYDLDQLEALNVVTDRLQPTVWDEPAWLLRARALLGHDPQRALQMALAAAVALAGELHGHLQEPA